MAPIKPKLRCQKCSTDMNHHADKVDYTFGLKDPKSVDSAFGGILDEFHACPKCGDVATRHAEH